MYTFIKDGKIIVPAIDRNANVFKIHPISKVSIIGYKIPNFDKAIELIKERNTKIEKLCKELEDTVVIVMADHRHINIEPIYLKNYPEIYNLLERTTLLEQSAISFKIKGENQELFVRIFNKKLGKFFKLYSKEEIINCKLFGDGEENELFNSALGDYIAITENSSKCLLDEGDKLLKSEHAGYIDDEIYIPLIVKTISKKLNN